MIRMRNIIIGLTGLGLLMTVGVESTSFKDTHGVDWKEAKSFDDLNNIFTDLQSKYPDGLEKSDIGEFLLMFANWVWRLPDFHVTLASTQDFIADTVETTLRALLVRHSCIFQVEDLADDTSGIAHLVELFPKTSSKLLDACHEKGIHNVCAQVDAMLAALRLDNHFLESLPAPEIDHQIQERKRSKTVTDADDVKARLMVATESGGRPRASTLMAPPKIPRFGR